MPDTPWSTFSGLRSGPASTFHSSGPVKMKFGSAAFFSSAKYFGISRLIFSSYACFRSRSFTSSNFTLASGGMTSCSFITTYPWDVPMTSLTSPTLSLNAISSMAVSFSVGVS